MRQAIRLFTILVGLAISTSSAQSEPSELQPQNDWARSRIVPLVAHHQHLLSPEGSSLISPRIEDLPPAPVPVAVQSLLDQRETPGDDIQSLYAPGAQVLDPDVGSWARSADTLKATAAAFASGRFSPTAVSMDRDTGAVAGTVRFGSATKPSHNFLWALRRGADGRWRIAMESITRIRPPTYPSSITSDDLIREMNEVGIARAVILSTSYFFSSGFRSPQEREYEKLRADNDWHIAQALKYPERLVVFCGINPLRDYALQELERCSKIPIVKGIKLHFGNAKLDVTDRVHLEKTQDFFRAANERKMALVVHLWTTFGDYGSRQANIFLNQILPYAPNVTIQIAHLAGAGPGYEEPEEKALAVYADAIMAKDPRMKNVYFDVATNVTGRQDKATTDLIVRRLRQVGLKRVLFGSDMSLPPEPALAAQWAAFRRSLPLTDAELRIIASNVAPYMR